MIVMSGRYYLLFHLTNEIGDEETHLVIDLSLAGAALDTLAALFTRTLSALPSALQAHKAEFRVGIEPEAALLLSENLLEQMLDEIEDEHGGPPVMVDLLTDQQFCLSMDVAILAGDDFERLLSEFGETVLDEWEHPYSAQLVLRPDETGSDVFLLPEVQAGGLRESRAGNALTPCCHTLRGTAGYRKWSDIRHKIKILTLLQ